MQQAATMSIGPVLQKRGETAGETAGHDSHGLQSHPWSQ